MQYINIDRKESFQNPLPNRVKCNLYYNGVLYTRTSDL